LDIIRVFRKPLGPPMTVFSISKNNADIRIQQILKQLTPINLKVTTRRILDRIN